MSKIAAFSDLHLSPAGRKTDDDTGLNARFLDVVRSMEWIVKDANERGCSSMLFGGDMFRTNRPTPTELMYARNALAQWPYPLIMIPGNHDLPRGRFEHNSLAPIARAFPPQPDHVSAIGSPGMWLVNQPMVIKVMSGEYSLATLPYPNKTQLATSLPGYADMADSEIESLLGAHLGVIIQGLAAECQERGLPSVLLAHISVDTAKTGDEGIMAGRDICLNLAQIPESFTCVVLGHIHRGQRLRENVYYCGSPDRVDFGEEEKDDQEPKSYLVIDTETGYVERIPVPTRPFRTFHVNMKLVPSDIPGSLVTETTDDLPGYDTETAGLARNAVCRVKLRRPASARPDYADVEGRLRDAGCWDFRGFVEDVDQLTGGREPAILTAGSPSEMLGIWATGRDLPAGITPDDLQSAYMELCGAQTEGRY